MAVPYLKGWRPNALGKGCCYFSG